MTPSEVTAVVQEVLGTDQIAADDNFFDVGGNSMLALTLISRIKARCGTSLPLIELISNPTPAGMARVIAQSGAGAGTAVPGTYRLADLTAAAEEPS